MYSILHTPFTSRSSSCRYLSALISQYAFDCACRNLALAPLLASHFGWLIDRFWFWHKSQSAKCPSNADVVHWTISAPWSCVQCVFAGKLAAISLSKHFFATIWQYPHKKYLLCDTNIGWSWKANKPMGNLSCVGDSNQRPFTLSSALKYIQRHMFDMGCMRLDCTQN